jgi:ectoine hydroxylase-related dioxygenase (phytanoyl-CoA dioxygenase family)
MNNSNLPSLESEYQLNPESVDHYQQNGWALIRGLASPTEVDAYRQPITTLTTEYAKNYKPMEERDTYGKAFIQHMNLWLMDEQVRRFTLSKRFAGVAAKLMGVERVRVYHDQALYKEPQGGPTPWHQDQQYWPLDGVRCVTLWMPLVDASKEMGTLNFANGSQSLGYLGPMNISDDSDTELENRIQTNGFEVVSAGDMTAGDATFHNGWCIHGAPGNASHTTTREVMTIIYFEDGAVISQPDSPQRENDLATWFPGLRAGDKAASEINPLV